jgi:lysophospholipase L1-like esterase
MNNTIQLYVDKKQEIKGYPITSPDRVIDENGVSIKEQLDNIANKGTTVEVLERVTKEEIDRQIADGTIANLTIEDGSVTKEKLSKELNDFIQNQINLSYNTILQLPYTSRENEEILLHLEKQSKNDNITYVNYITNNNFTDGTTGFTQGIGSLDVFEATVFDNRNCIKLSKIGKNYGQIKFIRDGFTYEKDKYYYFSYEYYIESAEPQISKENITFLGLHQYDNTQIGKWVKKSIIATPPSTYLNAPHSTFQFTIEVGTDFVTEAENVTTTIYMTNFKLVNLSDDGLYKDGDIPNGYVTDEYIKSIDEKISKADIGKNSIYGCNVLINNVIVETSTFKSNETINIFKSLSQGDIISISEVDGYTLPKATLMSKSFNSENNGGNSDYLQSNIIKTRFYGKRFYFDGDSITDFDFQPAYNNKSWANYCAETLGASSVTNVAVGGIKIGEVLTRTKATDFSNYDVVFIAVGTNNIPANTTLGEYNSSDETTMAGALNSIIRHIQISNPYASIFVLSPIHRYPGDSYYEKLVAIKNIYEEVCQYNSVNCINMLKCGINAKDQTLYGAFLSDGLHPTIEGHKRMAQYIVGQVSSL